MSPGCAGGYRREMTPGVLARHLDGNRVAPKVWANRGLIGPLSSRLIRTLLTNRQGARYRLLGHLWLECQRFLAPNVRNVDLADLDVDGTLVEGDVTRHCRLVLCAMCKLLECRTVFEIGTYVGRTTWLIARNNPDARVFTLDLPSLDAARRLNGQKNRLWLLFPAVPYERRSRHYFCRSRRREERSQSH